MVIYLSGPNGMYPIRDHKAYYEAMARSLREASSGWADRRCAGRRADRRALLLWVGVVLVAMLFILGWV